MKKSEDKIYCIGMEAIKSCGIDRWQKEFFTPFSVKSYEIFSARFYGIYKEILSSGLSDAVKDILSARVDLIRRYAHFVHKDLLIKKLTQNGYRAVYPENETYSKFNREKVCNLLQDDLNTRVKYASLNFFSKSYGLLGFKECFNVGQAVYRLKSMYARQKRLYPRFKPYRELIGLKESVPGVLSEELRWVVSNFSDTRRRIFDDYGLEDNDKNSKEADKMLLEDLSLSAKLYLGTKERLNSLHHSHILATSLGNVVNRIILRILSTGERQITGFNHGNTLGLIYDSVFLLTELLVVTNYVVQTDAVKDFFDNLVRMNCDFPLPRRPVIESVRDDYFSRIYNREKKNFTPGKSKKVMIVQSSFNEVFTLFYGSLYYSVQLDLNLRIMRALRRRGYYVMLKMRMDRLGEIDGGKIFEDFADECVKGVFEKEYQRADTIVFPHVFTSTFGFSLATSKKLIYFLYEKEKFIPEVLALLDKRCIPINCRFDDRNRIVFDENELIEALEREHTTINTEFLERRLFSRT